MKLLVLLVVVVVVVAVSSACGRPNLDTYRISCELDEDCVMVSSSQSCDCRCGDMAINVEEVERFEREQAPFCPFPSVVECLCVAFQAECNNGECAATANR